MLTAKTGTTCHQGDWDTLAEYAAIVRDPQIPQSSAALQNSHLNRAGQEDSELQQCRCGFPCDH
jgi:hypothetical protein